jgi:hypothetical protein
VNAERRFFSYEHFYVIFCTFCRLDEDSDHLLDIEVLAMNGLLFLSFVAILCPWTWPGTAGTFFEFFLSLAGTVPCSPTGQSHSGTKSLSRPLPSDLDRCGGHFSSFFLGHRPVCFFCRCNIPLHPRAGVTVRPNDCVDLCPLPWPGTAGTAFRAGRLSGSILAAGPLRPTV